MPEPSDERPGTAVLVLSWNARADVLRCLESLRADAPGVFDVVVIDNGSADGTPDAVRAGFPEVNVLENGRNLGFSGGNNRGLDWAREVGYAFAFLLNQDTTVEPGCVARLVRTLGEDPGAAAVGPLIEYADSTDRIAALGGEIRWDRLEARQGWNGRGVHEAPGRPFPTDFLTGAALLVRLDAVRRVGPLPEPYFYGMEDAAWSVRFRRAGYRLLAEPRARVKHHESSATGASSPLKAYYMGRNALLFLKLEGQGSRVGPIVGYHVKAAKLTLKWLGRGEIARLAGFWRGYVDFLRGRVGAR